MEPCALCRMNIQVSGSTGGDRQRFNCPRCGTFKISGSAKAMADAKLPSNLKLRAISSHSVRKMQRDGTPPMISSEILENIWTYGTLPTPAEQANMLVLLIGGRQVFPEHFVPVGMPFLAGELGTGDDATKGGTSGVDYILKYARQCEWVEAQPSRLPNELEMRLTIGGWERHAALRHATSESRTAFMAMKYGRKITDALFKDHLKPAVGQTGFELRRLDEKPTAGLIDQRMELEIRTARFLIADLTYGNRGAYWEAGFARGLGKPVFYLCDAARFRRVGTHFDTNHHYTIPWDASRPTEAAEALKNAIRSTLPAEAKLID